MATLRSIGTGFWMTAAFVAALVVAAPILALLGSEEHGTDVALRATARLSFLLFWPAYAGAALTILFGARFAILARHGRDFGLSFASAHLVHIGLILWLYRGLGRSPIQGATLLFDAVGVVAIYLLALFSVDRARRLLSPRTWRLLRDGAMHYIALVFFADFVIAPLRFGLRHPIEYLPFSALVVAAPLLRLAATVKGQAAS